MRHAQISWVPGKVQLASHSLSLDGFGYFPLKSEQNQANKQGQEDLQLASDFLPLQCII